MIRYRRRKRKNIGTYIGISVLFAVIAVITLLVVKADKAVRPVAEILAKHFAEIYTNMIIEKAVSDYLKESELQYSDFAAVLYDENGKAVSVETLPYNINKVQSELGLAINKSLECSGKISDSIPLGSLTGSYLFAGKGPSLKIRICPVGKACIAVRSDIESTGINQTRHSISALITADISSSLPLYKFESSISFEFLLAETLIIGDVPDFTPYTWTEQ